MKEYIVSWYIDVSAESPGDAALQARTMMQDINSLATIFEVMGEDGRNVTVDTANNEAIIIKIA